MENERNTIITPSRKLVKTCSVNEKYKKCDHHAPAKSLSGPSGLNEKYKTHDHHPTAKSSSGPAV
jgi:hypothetical protein